jgi:hypothetical protein
VVTADDDTAGVTASIDTLTVAEGGGPGFFTLRLDAEPGGDVVLAVSSADTGDVTVSPAVLTFRAIDWDTPQNVAVTAVDDEVVDGDRQTQVVIAVDAAQSDSGYASVPSVVLTVTTTDKGVATPSGPVGR